jgi:hypothetical protein
MLLWKAWYILQAMPFDNPPFAMYFRFQILTFGWLMDYSLLKVPLKIISLIWRCHHYRWRDAKFWLLLGTQGLWARTDLYRAIPAVTRGLGVSGRILRTAPPLTTTKHWGKCDDRAVTVIRRWRSLIRSKLFSSIVKDLFLVGFFNWCIAIYRTHTHCSSPVI